ncbi:hypothetical protein C7C46_32965 [Streptomyces tateyamensis]|uniref:Orc1-like AAA ATPase domain-containing protein n=1 Tax=Streptomyces tateyamensis TaxID=565073 RepID=A0A2V4N4B2_9ACTN|nr:hypothetical protein [Streptomyces tateyamensis]PYC64337.1 hypothetical protein C7C46_32965 [Streptomyces tateyamensis]
MSTFDPLTTLLGSTARYLKRQPALLYGLVGAVVVGTAAEGLGASGLLALGAVLLVVLLALGVWFWQGVRRGSDPQPPDPAGPGAFFSAKGARRGRVSDVRVVSEGDRAEAVLEASRNLTVSGVEVRADGGPAGFSAERARGTAFEGIRIAAQGARPAAAAPTLREQRDRVLAELRRRGRLRVGVLADSGCGKSLLLAELTDALKQQGFATVFVTAQRPSYGTADGQQRLAEQRESADLIACQALVAAMADDLREVRSAAGDPLHERLLATREAWLSNGGQHVQATLDLTAAHRVSLTNTTVQVTAVPVPSSPQQERLLRMQQRVLDELAPIARRRQLAVLVDDLQFVLGTPVGDWLIGLLDGLGDAVVVHARRPASDGTAVPRTDLEVRLGLMGEPEVLGFTADRLAAAGWAAQPARACAAAVYQATKGHPLGVATCTEIVAETVPVDAPVATARRAFLGGDRVWEVASGARATREYLQEQAEVRAGVAVPELFDLLLVMRRCPEPAFLGVLAGLGVAEQAAGRLHDWLFRSDFTTKFDDDREQGWRLHDYLRENLGSQLAADSPRTWRQTHALVERHYRGVLNFDIEIDTDSPHAAGARFEDPDFQRDSQEWLYHASNLREKEFVGARQAMIRLFVEAFWWWGTEIDSLYCQQLIHAYRLALPPGADGEWVEVLDQLRTGYVAGLLNQVPGRDAERWARAGQAATRLRMLLGIDRRTVLPSDPDLRRIHLILNTLQGDIAWFGSSGTERDRAKAVTWYRLTADLEVERDERWIRAWAVWLTAALVGEVPARTGEARALLERIRHDLDEDNELRVLVVGSYADLAWSEAERATGEERARGYALALDLHIRQVLLATVYQVDQEVPNQHPNEYSRSVLETALVQAGERFELAAGLGIDGLAERAAARSRLCFAAFWHSLGQAGPGWGFPPPPAQQDLVPTERPYAQAVLALVGATVELREQEPDEPLNL